MKDKNTCIRIAANALLIRQCQEKIAATQRSLTQLSGVLSLAGGEARLKILYLLVEEKELCPCDLSDILGMSIPAISQHLRKLKDGNMIASRRQGQTIYYFLTPGASKLLGPLLKLLKNNTMPESV